MTSDAASGRLTGRTVLRDAALTLMASGITLALLNVSSVLIVRMLGVAGRGEVAAAVLVPTIIAYAGWFGLPVATGYWVNAEPSLRASIVATARSLAVVISLVLTLLSVLLSAMFPLHESVRVASMVFALFIPMNLFVGIYQAVMQADLRTRVFNLVRLSGAILYVVLLVALDLFDAASTTNVVLAQLAGNVVWLVLSMALTKSRPWFAFDKTVARSLLSFGTRAHLGSISPVDSLRVDQLILGLFLSTYDLGLYVVVMTFVVANRIIGMSVGMVAFPVASRTSAGDAHRKRLILGALVAGTMVLAGVTAGIEILLGRPLLRILFDVRSDEAYRMLAILAVGSVFMCGRQVYSDVLRGLGKPGIPTVAELSSLATLCVFAYALWSKGLTGVAWAVTISAGVAFFVLVLVSSAQRLHLPFGRLAGRPALFADSFRSPVNIAVILGLVGVSAGTGLAVAQFPPRLVIALLLGIVLVFVAGVVVARYQIRGIASLALGAAAATLSMSGIRLTASVALSDVFMLIAAMILLPSLAGGAGKYLTTVQPLLRGTMLIVFGGFLGSFFAPDPEASVLRLFRFMVAAALVPILFAVWKPTFTEIRRVSWLWVLSATASALVGVAEVDTSFHHRADGLTTHPNHLALASVLALGPAIALTLLEHGVKRLVGFGCCAALSAGLVVSGSRAGILGYMATLVAMAVLSRRREVSLGIVAGGVVGVLLVSASVVQLPAGNALSRLLGSEDQAVNQGVTASNAERQDAFRIALDRAMDHPITGEGFADALSGHDIYIQIWSSAGVFGLVGLVLTFAAILRPAVRSYLFRIPTADPSALLLLMGFSASFAGFVATSPLQPALWDRYIWIGPAIIACVTPYALAHAPLPRPRAAEQPLSPSRQLAPAMGLARRSHHRVA